MTEIIIKPPSKFVFFDFKELSEFKDTLFFLAWKDIKIKYKQALLGFLWVILQPVLMTAVFVVFSIATNFTPIESNVPYILFVLSGMILWNLFSSAITQTTQSIVSNAHIIKKIYFPRIFFPLSSLLVSTFDFLISFIILIPFMIYFNVYPQWQVIFLLPMVYLLITMLILGIGSFFSALNVKYRDVKYIIPFMVQLMFFVSPVFYSNHYINIQWIKVAYYFNPITGIIELFRYALFNTTINVEGLLISSLICIIVFVLGLLYFRKVEYNFADIS
ncbi:MAG: ABC transporter permease [Bacteroidales bacterium]|nr:ABC transporter permease [Bacteroidales bacterium]